MGEITNYVHDLNHLILQHNLEHKYEFDQRPNDTLVSKKESLCTLHIKLPGTETLDYTFEAIGTNKKQSKQIAASKALSKINELKLFEIDDNSLYSAIKKALSSKGLSVDPVFHTYLHLIHEELDGWIPIGLITNCKKVRRWHNNNCPEIILQEFTRDFLDLFENDEEIFEIDKERHLLYPKEKVHLHQGSLEKIKNNAKEVERAKGVYIPQDLNEEIKEIEITSEELILKQVSKILQEPMTSILHWTNVGRKLSSLESLPNENGEVKVIKEMMKEPTMWSTFENLNEINDRASWIAGCRVYGPVFLTICRPVPEDGSKENVKWRDYDISYFYRSCSSLFPESLLLRKVKTMPLILRMPQKFNSLISWKGILPSVLFYEVFKFMDLKEVPSLNCKDDTWSYTWHLNYLDSIKLEIETEYYPDQKLALEQCYFAALKELSQAFKTHIFKITDTKSQIRNFRIIKNGYATKPVISESHFVKLNYILSVKVEDTWEKIEEKNNYIIELGTGSVIQELEDALKGHTINTTLEFEFEISILAGLDILNPNEKILSKMEVQVLGISNSKLSMVKVFDPVLSIQRYNAVLKLLSENEIQSFLDLGCGSGKMLQYILKSNLNKIETLYGLDVRQRALQIASEKLYDILKMKSHHSSNIEEEDKVSVSQVPLIIDQNKKTHVEILCGNIMDNSEKWQKFKSVDAVVMIEVIEHLDPGPLSHVGEIVLGNIKPNWFILTTPNWEYNKLLYYIAGEPNIKVLGRDKTPLRCSDHRFEWTREEFEEWCQTLSERYGYDVRYEGIGKATSEDEARKELNMDRNVNIGLSSQMAVFMKRDDFEYEDFGDCVVESDALKLVWSSKDDLVVKRSEFDKEDEMLSVLDLDDESHF